MAYHHHTATLSDATSVASSTPFSPFSSAFSTASEAATVVSDGQADLGAFNSVFFALSQLQLQHNNNSHSPRRHPLASQTLGVDERFLQQPAAVNSTLATPNFRPHSMSPFSLGRASASRVQSTPSDDDPQPAPFVDDTKSDTTGLTEASSSASAAEDGDEESLEEALTSPQSHSSSDPLEEEKDEEILEYDPSKGWSLMSEHHQRVYTEDVPSVPSSGSLPSSDSQSPKYETILPILRTDRDDGPSLGEFSSAFEFFAAERAKLAKHGDPSNVRSGNGTPTSSPKKKGRKNASKRKAPITKTGDNTSVRVVAHFNKGKAEKGVKSGALNLAPGPAQISSDDVDAGLANPRKPVRGILPRPKQAYSTSVSYPSGLAGALTPNKPNAIPISNSARRLGSHRHTRSLPNNNSQLALALTDPLSADAITRIKSLARRLTFQFPTDAPTLRRVIANPEVALGFGSHPAPTDDALVAGGFFDPIFGSDGMTNGPIGSGVAQEDHLYVFIDHSNILVGYLEWLKKQPADVFASGKRPVKPKLSHTALVLLLARGRQSMRKVLVASSPLHQSLDEIASMGYQISVLQRVEIKEGATGTPPSAAQSRPKQRGRKGQKSANKVENSQPPPGDQVNSGSSTESDYGGQKATPAYGRNASTTVRHNRRNISHDAAIPPSASSKPSGNNTTSADALSGQAPTALSSSPPGRPRFREEAVDELLQLKLLQTLLDAPSPPPPGSTIVLASGDAARSQFNPQGFLGCVRKAVERGWKVEVVGWDEGRSRAYGELMTEVERGGIGRGAGGSLNIISLDQWGLDLIEV